MPALALPDQAQPRSVKIPRSADSRKQRNYALLLKTIKPEARSGFDIEGRHFKCGQLVSEHDLRPDGTWPATPILLEHAGAEPIPPGTERSAWGHRRSRQVYILWRYDIGTGEWDEIARAASVDGSWILDLREILVRAVRPAPRPRVLDFQARSRRAVRALEQEMDGLREEERCRLANVIYDELVARLA